MAEMLYELTVLNDIAKIMEPLKKDEQRRILMWLEDYFGIYDEDEFGFSDDDVEIEPTKVFVIEDDVIDDEYEDEAEDEPEENTLESFFDKAHPKTAIQKIVCAAYWIETEQNKDSWKSFEVNKLLKSLDIKVSSVSGTLALEAKKDDPMIVVLDKSSDSMQGRKTFRLSDTGYAFVNGRIA